MIPAVRLGDTCSGHGSFPPRASTGASPDVFINSIPAHRLSDSWAPHGSASPSPPHGSTAAAGSPDVFTNNLNQCRIGDPIACGSVMVSGSGNVFVN